MWAGLLVDAVSTVADDEEEAGGEAADDVKKGGGDTVPPGTASGASETAPTKLSGAEDRAEAAAEADAAGNVEVLRSSSESRTVSRSRRPANRRPALA